VRYGLGALDGPYRLFVYSFAAAVDLGRQMDRSWFELLGRRRVAQIAVLSLIPGTCRDLLNPFFLAA
jgi:hypothetical protein